MPSTRVDREQGAERHLAAAKEYVAIAEAGDAKRSAYEHAADEIIAAQKDDPTLTYDRIAAVVGKSPRWVGTLVQWRTNPHGRATPFGGDTSANRAARNSATKQVARERPDDYVAAFEQAPPEAQKAIAGMISRSPKVREAVRTFDENFAAQRQPSPVKPRTDHALHEYESRLVSAQRSLRDALALVDGIDQPGDDEDIVDLLVRLRELVAANEEAYKTGKSLDTWAWELYERSGTDG